MMPVYDDGRVHLYHGDVMDIADTLPPDTIDASWEYLDIAVRRLSSTPLPLPIDDGVVA